MLNLCIEIRKMEGTMFIHLLLITVYSFGTNTQAVQRCILDGWMEGWYFIMQEYLQNKNLFLYKEACIRSQADQQEFVMFSVQVLEPQRLTNYSSPVLRKSGFIYQEGVPVPQLTITTLFPTLRNWLKFPVSNHAATPDMDQTTGWWKRTPDHQDQFSWLRVHHGIKRGKKNASVQTT